MNERRQRQKQEQKSIAIAIWKLASICGMPPTRTSSLFLLLFFFFCRPSSAYAERVKRAIGGVAVLPDEMPWLASIRFVYPYGQYRQCTASLIHERYLLTAAHCVFEHGNLLKAAANPHGKWIARIGSVLAADPDKSDLRDIDLEAFFSRNSISAAPPIRAMWRSLDIDEAATGSLKKRAATRRSQVPLRSVEKNATTAAMKRRRVTITPNRRTNVPVPVPVATTKRLEVRKRIQAQQTLRTRSETSTTDRSWLVREMKRLENNTAERLVVRIAVHPQFNNPPYHNDVALLALHRPVARQRGNFLKLTTISPYMKQEQCVFAGWGCKAWNSPPVNHAQKLLHLKKKSPEICRMHIPVFDEETQICADSFGSQYKSICDGDSGGPFVCWYHDQWKQAGIASLVADDGSSVGVFENITYYSNWITQTIGTLERSRLARVSKRKEERTLLHALKRSIHKP